MKMIQEHQNSSLIIYFLQWEKSLLGIILILSGNIKDYKITFALIFLFMLFIKFKKSKKIQTYICKPNLKYPNNKKLYLNFSIIFNI